MGDSVNVPEPHKLQITGKPCVYHSSANTLALVCAHGSGDQCRQLEAAHRAAAKGTECRPHAEGLPHDAPGTREAQAVTAAKHGHCTLLVHTHSAYLSAAAAASQTLRPAAHTSGAPEQVQAAAPAAALALALPPVLSTSTPTQSTAANTTTLLFALARAMGRCSISTAAGTGSTTELPINNSTSHPTDLQVLPKCLRHAPWQRPSQRRGDLKCEPQPPVHAAPAAAAVGPLQAAAPAAAVLGCLCLGHHVSHMVPPRPKGPGQAASSTRQLEAASAVGAELDWPWLWRQQLLVRLLVVIAPALALLLPRL